MSRQAILNSVASKFIKKDVPQIRIGDTVNVHFRIVEGDKERTQVFQGVVIARSRSGINEMMTVRRIVDEVGIERLFPIHSPLVAKIEAIRHGDARRSKLYYLRDRRGKSRRLRDARRGLKGLEVPGESVPAAAPAPAEPAKK